MPAGNGTRRALRGLADALGWSRSPGMPPGRMLVASGIQWFGSGLFRTGIVVLAVATLSVEAKTVGFALSAGALVGIGVSIGLGRLADARGLKNVFVGASALQGLLFLVYALVVDDPATFVVATIVVESLEVALPALAQAAVAQLSTGPERIRYMALQRTMVNVAIGVGALAAGALLINPSDLAFDVVLVVNGATYLIAALLVATVAMPHTRHRSDAGGARRAPSGRRLLLAARRRSSLLGLAALDGVMTLYLVILNVGLPLWVTLRTTAPAYVVGPLYFLNTALCVLLQARTTASTTGFRKARRSEIHAGAALLAACLLFATAGAVEDVGAVVAVLVVGVVMLTFGELVHSSVSWQIAFAQTEGPNRASGLAVYGVGRTLAQVVGPTALAFVVSGGGAIGWFAVGFVFLAAAGAIAASMGRMSTPEPGVERV